MIGKDKEIINKDGTIAALLTDLSKAFDCTTFDLLITKLCALNFDINARNLILDHMAERKERVKINSTYSLYMDVSQGFQQGTILAPLLFNLILCVM